jgi:hypothetical protein
MSDATFTPSTVTTSTFNIAATQFQSGDWSTKNATTHFSYDVAARVEANNILAFAIYTNTGREQTLKDVKLVLNYSDAPVAKYSYSLKAVTAGDDEIETLASGEEYETNDVTLYFPYMFYKSTTLYTTATTPYDITVDKDHATKKVTYATASSNIVAYMEGESATANSGFDAAYSNGKNGYAAGNNTVTITTLPAGKYTATIYLVSNGNRSIVIRDKDNTDVDNNVIATLPISKTSSAGTYTSDEFILTEETTIGFSGYTSGTKTNQSADIDYIYIQKTGEVATIGSTGYTTFASPYALNLSGMTASTGTVTAFYASASDASSVTMTSTTATVAAGEGLLLKGTAGATITIPVVASGDAISGNKLVGCTTSTALTADANYWVLVNNGGTAEFQNLAENGATIPAGKAYLNISGAGVKALNIVFDGTTTGVEAPVAAEAVEDGIYYNVNGQQVTKDYKGIVIVNGKKFYNK